MSNSDKPAKARNQRQARLAEELRANLARRKAQTRARRKGEPDERGEGIATGKDRSPEGEQGSRSRSDAANGD